MRWAYGSIALAAPLPPLPPSLLRWEIYTRDPTLVAKHRDVSLLVEEWYPFQEGWSAAIEAAWASGKAEACALCGGSGAARAAREGAMRAILTQDAELSSTCARSPHGLPVGVGLSQATLHMHAADSRKGVDSFFVRMREGQEFVMDLSTGRRRMIRRLAPLPDSSSDSELELESQVEHLEEDEKEEEEKKEKEDEAMVEQKQQTDAAAAKLQAIQRAQAQRHFTPPPSVTLETQQRPSMLAAAAAIPLGGGEAAEGAGAGAGTGAGAGAGAGGDASSVGDMPVPMYAQHIGPDAAGEVPEQCQTFRGFFNKWFLCRPEAPAT